MPVGNPELARTWRRNALFRVLAFLDSTGEQTFELREEVDSNGVFLRPETVFADSTAIHAVIEAGLAAIRENIDYLFTDETERDALFCLVGTGQKQGRETASASAASEKDSRTDGKQPAADEPRSPVPKQTEREKIVLPDETRWSRQLRRPKSFADFADRLSGSFPLNLLCRVEEVMGVPARSLTDSPLTEQFLIDALDRWMAQRTVGDNERLLLACGVQPAVLEVVAARSAETPFALTDFVIDVVFPSPEDVVDAAAAGETAAPDDSDASTPAVLDWLLLTYQHNHESIDVEGEATASDGPEDARDGSTQPAQRPRHEARDDGPLRGWQPENEEEGEVVLTADNIDRYMREKPSIIPAEIIREKRKSWKDPRITAFELEHHYTLAELKAAVKELASLTHASSEEVAAWETSLSPRRGERDNGDDASTSHSFVRGSVTEALMRDASRATKKADILRVLLSLHNSAGEQVRVEEVALKEGAAASNVGGPRAVDDVTSAAKLVKHFTLRELQDHLESRLGEKKPPATKKKCADLIVAKRRCH